MHSLNKQQAPKKKYPPPLSNGELDTRNRAGESKPVASLWRICKYEYATTVE
jgi:hypothetical protein